MGMRSGLRFAALGVAAACAVVSGVTACDAGPFDVDRVTVTQLEPQSFDRPDAAGDPLVMPVYVTWTKEGWCSGQFTVQATETPTEVRVGTVTSVEHSKGGCAGIGTAADHTATVVVRLAAPLGDRDVIRDSDGVHMPTRSVHP